MSTLLLMLILITLPGFSTDVFAGDYFSDEAQKAFNKKDYKTAYEKWKPLAEKGDPAAQYQFGVRYYEGNGVAKDYEVAFKWYQLAAEQGETRAQLNLGGMYESGIGVPQNNIIAYKWFQLAYANGNVAGRSFIQTLERLMTTQQISEGKKLANEWLAKHKMPPIK